jgi:hypothetical protein
VPIQRLNGLPSAYDVGNNVGDYLTKTADAAANAVCSLYRNHPGFVLPPTIFGLGQSQQNAARGLWDSLCGGRGTLPSPPAVPFTGGQCPCALYDIVIQSKDEVTGVTGTLGVRRAGAIGGIVREPSPTDSNRERVSLLFNVGCNGSPGQKFPISEGNKPFRVTFSILSCNPVPGQPNNCGNPPPRYPDTSPPTSSTGGSTTIINNDGVNLTVPFAYIPVDITPTFSPQIRIDLGGLNFRFDLGGVDVQFPPLAPSPPNAPSLPSGGGSNPPCPPCPPCPDVTPGGGDDPAPGDPDLPPTEPVEPDGEQNAPGIKYLEVVLTTLPDKLQFGNRGQQTVYFAGWIAFRAKSGSYYPREQIHFQKSLFKAPDGADGFTCTFTNKAKGTVRFYTESPSTS